MKKVKAKRKGGFKMKKFNYVELNHFTIEILFPRGDRTIN